VSSSNGTVLPGEVQQTYVEVSIAPQCAPRCCGVQVVSIGGDALRQLLVAALQFGVIAMDVLAHPPKELLVVSAFEMVPASAVDGSHQRRAGHRPVCAALGFGADVDDQRAR
jgi:hypothetical protein